MISIINYGMGNLRSVAKALEHVGGKVCVTSDAKQIKKSSKIILPGVGAFTKCMESLQKLELVEILKEEIGRGKWFLGICLGLQLLFEESEEFGPTPGLGILKGKVKKFKVTDPKLKVPHMGWNQIRMNVGAGRWPALFKDIPQNISFYFVHSYYVDPEDTKIIATTTEYETPFCSSIEKENIFACQFHPEKSQKSGLKVLENFVKL